MLVLQNTFPHNHINFSFFFSFPNFPCMKAIALNMRNFHRGKETRFFIAFLLKYGCTNMSLREAKYQQIMSHLFSRRIIWWKMCHIILPMRHLLEIESHHRYVEAHLYCHVHLYSQLSYKLLCGAHLQLNSWIERAFQCYLGPKFHFKLMFIAYFWYYAKLTKKMYPWPIIFPSPSPQLLILGFYRSGCVIFACAL